MVQPGGSGQAGGSVECGCGRRAAGADAELRTRARSAEAAAAADFDPLRIRPYVSLPDPETRDDTPGAGGTHSSGRTAKGPPGRTTTEGPESTRGAEATQAAQDAQDAETSRVPEGRGGRTVRKRALVLLAGAGAAAALTAATVFAMGMLSSASDGPTRDRALPGDPASAYADPTKPAAPSAKPSASPSHALAAAPGGKPSPTASRTHVESASPSSSARSRTPSPSTARATGSVGASPPPPHRPTDATLRPGDEGPRVVELQGRLAQLDLYTGERDGRYSYEVTEAVLRYQWARGLSDDMPGEYGRETRRSLESETTEP
ncbi:peptidoglycan-binding protein [Streptomyces sp. NPDC002564]|uniref:peptidoglycan-binding domain-containing protein n=1 Tax=Streptomyces sp. NPDC002564 TaxID=3364649 RepID=UPI00369D8606